MSVETTRHRRLGGDKEARRHWFAMGVMRSVARYMGETDAELFSAAQFPWLLHELHFRRSYGLSNEAVSELEAEYEVAFNTRKVDMFNEDTEKWRPSKSEVTESTGEDVMVVASRLVDHCNPGQRAQLLKLVVGRVTADRENAAQKVAHHHVGAERALQEYDECDGAVMDAGPLLDGAA